MHIARKEYIQLIRNKQNFRMLLIAPLVQLLLFGFAVRLDVKNVVTVVADMDRSSMSRSLVQAFSRSGYFVIEDYLDSYDEIDRYLDGGYAKIAILIPPDFERRIKGDRTAQVGILIDGVDTTTASTVAGYARAITETFSLDLLENRIGWARGLRYAKGLPDIVIPDVTAEARAWFNPNLDSKEYFVPGTLVLILTFLGITVTAMAIVREKETGTIEQLMVTPITRFELIMGKALPCFAVCVISLTVMTILSFIVFRPIFRGSMLLFFSTAILFIITCLGIGMTISVFCRTQQQAILSSFMVLQPSVILSGFVFPIENMPPIIQYVTYVNPLRYFMVIVRQVFLKGIGWTGLLDQIIPMTIIGLAFILLASILLKKRID
jgi:ABC-2 type transport system permease protein